MDEIDSFDSLFRKIMEQFSEAFESLPEGSGTYRSWSGSFVNEPLEKNVEQKNEPFVEKIDLGNSVLFIIEGQFDTANEPEVKAVEEKVTIKFGPGKEDIILSPGFKVDREKSTVSYRNGVIEVTLYKSENLNESEGYLRIE